MLTVSIVNYRNRTDTERCIRDLADVCANLPYRVLVRDNSETAQIDALADALAGLPLQVVYFSSPENPGFGRGHNLNFRAVEHAEGDVFLILNPDVRFHDPAVIPEMLRACSPTRIVSCAIAAASGGIWFAGASLGRVTGIPSVSRARFEAPFRDAAFVTGCCMMVWADLFRRLGGFDESYFMYSEDVDLCLRARRLGASCRVVNRFIVHGVGSGEKGRYSDLYLYQGTRNRLRCLRSSRRGFVPLGIACLLFKHGILRTLQLAVYSQNPLRQARAAWRGIREGLGIDAPKEGVADAAR